MFICFVIFGVEPVALAVVVLLELAVVVVELDIELRVVEVAGVGDADVQEGREGDALREALLVLLHRQHPLEAEVPRELPHQSGAGAAPHAPSQLDDGEDDRKDS